MERARLYILTLPLIYRLDIQEDRRPEIDERPHLLDYIK
jgi:hypothetical protein